MVAGRYGGLVGISALALVIAILLSPMTAGANDVEGRRWVVNRQTDPVTLETILSAAITGAREVQPRYLILTCYPKHAALYAVHAFGPLDLAEDDSRQMTERIDDEEPSQRIWRNMPQGKFGTFLDHDEALSFAREAKRAKTTIALAWRDRRARWTARGSTAAIEQVLEACNIEP